MKRILSVALAAILVFSLSACRKKRQSLEEMQEPMSMEALSVISVENESAAPTEAQEAKVSAPRQGSSLKPQVALPLPVPYKKPTAKEIQRALGNAGFYKGVIDGKIGPMSRKAIIDFQKANNLEPDGKVGSKTWAVLGMYLNTVSAGPRKR